MIRVALAGFSQGYYAVAYTRYLSRLRGIQVVAVCDCGADEAYVRECAFVDAKAFAGSLGAPLLRDYQSLLALRPDAVLICSETAEHAKMARAALECGIHVFVSKPLTFCRRDVQLLRAVPRHTVLLCGNPLKYERGAEEMHAKLLAGTIGEIYSLRLMINHAAMTKQEWERNEARSGGPLGTYGVYLFDLARWMTGRSMEQLYAVAANYNTPEITAPDTIKVLGTGEKGTQFSLELYSAIRHPYPFLQIEAIGKKGTLLTRYDNYATICQTTENTTFGALRESDMASGEMEHFLSCIRGEETERCSLADMEYVACCIEAVRRSLRKKAPVSIESCCPGEAPLRIKGG